MHGFRRSALRAAREGVIHELFKIDPLRPRQLARRLHDRLEPLKRRLLHHGCLVPRVDGAVARRHALKYVERGIRELRGDGLGHLTVRVGENPLLRPRDGVCEALHHVRMRRHVALARKIRRVRNLAALRADGAENIALPGQLHLRGRRLKERDIVAAAAAEGPGHHVKLHGRVDHGVLLRHKAVLAQDVLERHLRHAAGTSADHGFAAQILPREALVRPPHEERTVALGQLGEDARIVVLTLIIDVDAGLRPRKADVRLAGDDRRHDLVGAAAVRQLDLQPLVGEEALTHRDILRCIEHGMGNLVQPQDGLLIRLPAAGAQRREHPQRQHQRSHFLHWITPQ